MDFKNRYLVQAVKEDLNEKMVFLGGPRQVGKTTFARDLIGAFFSHQYYTWDKSTQRKEALKGLWPGAVDLIILDEFHKYSRWKTWIKGEYDVHGKQHKFLLTGSARLDIYRRGGDSLQGRYHFYRLHPFSIAELSNHFPSFKPPQEPIIPEKASRIDFDMLLRYGGFPEPLIRQNEKFLRRWQNEYIERLFKEDVRDLTRIQDLGHLGLLADILPERASQILSINALSIDLQVNHRTMSHWLDTFENFYYCFRVSPYQSRKIASVRKEKKLYLWDWAGIKKPASRLENIVASHLLKFCHYLRDHEGWDIELCYLRDETGREVDFLITFERQPWFAIEVKWEDSTISKNLFYFRDKLKIPFCYQVTQNEEKDFVKDGIRVLPAEKLLAALL